MIDNVSFKALLMNFNALDNKLEKKFLSPKKSEF